MWCTHYLIKIKKTYIYKGVCKIGDKPPAPPPKKNTKKLAKKKITLN